MAYDGITTAAAAAEMARELTGGYLSRIAQPESDALLLHVKTASGQKKLFLSAQASLPLAYLTETSRKAPLTAPNFCMLLRKYIGGGRISAVSQPGLERVLILHIERRDELGDMRSWRLITEIMGKHSNIILTDGDDTIIDSIKRVPASVSSVREVLPGRKWFIPNTAEKQDPLGSSASALVEKICAHSAPLYKAIYMSLTGFSPVISEELCFRAGLDGGFGASLLPPADRRALAASLEDLLDTVRSRRFSPELIRRSGTPLEFSAVSLTQYADLERQPYSSVSRLIETFFSEKESRTRMRQRSADLRHIVQTALERNARTLSVQEKQMKDTEKKETFRLYGELLHTYGYTVPACAKQAEVLNYYTDSPVVIPLDPRLTAMENAEKYFARYTKLKRTAEALKDRLEETRGSLEHLDSIAASLETAADEGDLLQIRRELTDSGYIRSGRTDPRKKEPKASPLHFRSSDGFDIYVGKNNYQNEEVSFRIASGGDWWFHAKKMPGSHVIVKSEGAELPDRTFEEAARLAAYYSKGKLAPKVEIDYTLKRNLRKPAKARPGFVVYYTNYSMMAEPDISGIEKIG